MPSAALLLLLAAASVRPFSAERELLDRRLEALRRVLPDQPNPAHDVALLGELARGRLSEVEITPRAPLETGPVGHVAMDVHAVARYADVERFFRQVALSPRLLDVERLALTATPSELVRLSAVVRAPYRSPRAPLPPPPRVTRVRLDTVPRAQADAYRRDLALALAKTEIVAGLRRQRRNPRLFLSELAAIARDRPVLVTSASLAEEFVVRGLVIGEGPLRALEARFEQGFLRIAEVLAARDRACHRFEVRGTSPVVGVAAELPIPTDEPFGTDDGSCVVDRDEGGAALVRAAGRGATRGPLTLRLRSVDLVDLFQVLHHLTGEGFLVAEAVRGRVSVEVTQSSLDEVLAAVRRLGVEVAGAAPLRIVRLAGAPADAGARPAPEGASVATFTMKRAEVRDVLALMTDLDPALASLGPEGRLGQVSVFARDAPVETVRTAVLEAAGLVERLEEERRVLERRGAAASAAVPVTAGRAERLLAQREDLTASELELAGVASDGSALLAFAYSPTGALHAYRAGDRIADAVVASVQGDGVVLETEEGTVRVPLPAP